jgi:hypothetical protein
MSVRAVRELLVQGAFHITEWALLSFLFVRFVWSLGSWSSISFFLFFLLLDGRHELWQASDCGHRVNGKHQGGAKSRTRRHDTMT